MNQDLCSRHCRNEEQLISHECADYDCEKNLRLIRGDLPVAILHDDAETVLTDTGQFQLGYGMAVHFSHNVEFVSNHSLIFTADLGLGDLHGRHLQQMTIRIS